MGKVNSFLTSQQPELFENVSSTSSIVKSWNEGLVLREESLSDSEHPIEGLRTPQIGAICAIKAHWSINDNKPAIIVMPTGSGKTDTMIACMIWESLEHVLVVVPTALLRSQIASKFEDLGILSRYGLLKGGVIKPNVFELKNWPVSHQKCFEIFRNNNVVVTTVAMISKKKQEEFHDLISEYDAVFFDEAHHTTAPTWTKIRNAFTGKRILQFTATPFRRDEKLILGKIIYNYPLSHAMRDGIFTKIHFHPIDEYDRSSADKKIAKKALSLLRSDREAGKDHMLLVRANTIDRANFLYDQFYNITENSDLFPVLVTSDRKKLKPKHAMELIAQKQAKIIVSVDMFGEGIDLPNLKIAALHDQYKSLPITLQFIGRITRSEANLGEAKFVANLGDETFIPALQKLYIENADWNKVLPELSRYAVLRRTSFQELVERFVKNEDEELELTHLLSIFKPTVSMRVFGYSDDSTININNWGVVLKGDPAVYVTNDENLLISFSKESMRINWMSGPECTDIRWGYSLVYIDRTRKLCYVNSSEHGINEFDLAKAIVPSRYTIDPEFNFRVFGGMKRLLLSNVGLKKMMGNRSITYQSFIGSNVEDGLSYILRHSSQKSNLFGTGYEGCGPETIGAAAKGRIWSFKQDNLDNFLRWAEQCGEKLTDSSISVESILKGVLKPKKIEELPPIGIICVEQNSDLISEKGESQYSVILDNQEIDIFDTELKPELEDGYNQYHLIISMIIGRNRAKVPLKMTLDNSGFRFKRLELLTDIKIKKGNYISSIEALLNDNPPSIIFADFSFLIGAYYVPIEEISSEIELDEDYLEVWNWDGVNIRSESYIPEKNNIDSVQYKVLEKEKDLWDVLYLDDGCGEIADIVALKDTDDYIRACFYHCKYSSEDMPGARKKDLYELCGQARLSAKWKNASTNLLKQLLRRSKGKENRFIKGSSNDFRTMKRSLIDKSLDLSIILVQPGVSKTKISIQMKNMLIATQSYLMDTNSIESRLICSL